MSDIMTRRAAFLPGEGAGAPPPAWAFSHSLNRDSRRKELRRITDENMRILRRIQSVAPRLDHRKWEEDRMKQVSGERGERGKSEEARVPLYATSCSRSHCRTHFLLV